MNKKCFIVSLFILANTAEFYAHPLPQTIAKTSHRIVTAATFCIATSSLFVGVKNNNFIKTQINSTAQTPQPSLQQTFKDIDPVKTPAKYSRAPKVIYYSDKEGLGSVSPEDMEFFKFSGKQNLDPETPHY